MVEWHHHLHGHEFKQAPGVGEGQGSLEYCSPWGQAWLIMVRHDWATEQQQRSVRNRYLYSLSQSQSFKSLISKHCNYVIKRDVI